MKKVLLLLLGLFPDEKVSCGMKSDEFPPGIGIEFTLQPSSQVAVVSLD